MLSQLRNRLLLTSMVLLILGFYFYLAQGFESNLMGLGTVLFLGGIFWIISLISRRNSIIRTIVQKPLWVFEAAAAGSASGVGVWILFFIR